MRNVCIAIVGVAWLAALPLLAEEIKLGKPVQIKNVTLVKDLLASPEKYLGQDVKVEGEITEVCQMMGCWINLRDASSKDAIQVKVQDGEIVFPKNSAGKKIVAQGKFERLVESKDEYIESLKEEARETGKKIDTSKIREGRTFYRIKGEGAVIR